jgi:hypothetical protein
MRKFLLILPLFFCLGCTTLDKPFVGAVDGAWSVIGPKYVEYLVNDSNMDEDIRNMRIQHAVDFGNMVKDAKKLIGGE